MGGAGGGGPASSSSAAAAAAAAAAHEPKRSKRSAGAAGHEDDEDTWEGCWSGDRRLAAVTSGVEWLLKQAPQQSHDEEEEEEAVVPALYALVRLTLDPVRQETLEALAPRLAAWKHACLAEAAATQQPVVEQGQQGGRWSQAGLVAALRRIVRLERLGVYAQEAAKRALAGAYVSGAAGVVCDVYVCMNKF